MGELEHRVTYSVGVLPSPAPLESIVRPTCDLQRTFETWRGLGVLLFVRM